MEITKQKNVRCLEQKMMQKINRIRTEGLNVKKRNAIVFFSKIIFAFLSVAYLLCFLFIGSYHNAIPTIYLLSLIILVFTMRYLLQLEDNKMYHYWGISIKEQGFFTFQEEAEREFRVLITNILDKELIEEKDFKGTIEDKEKLKFISNSLLRKQEELRVNSIVLTHNCAFIIALMPIAFQISKEIIQYFQLSVSDWLLRFGISVVVFTLIYAIYYAIYYICLLMKDIREKELKTLKNIHEYINRILENRLMKD